MLSAPLRTRATVRLEYGESFATLSVVASRTELPGVGAGAAGVRRPGRAADVRRDVDVRRAALVPAGVDRPDPGEAAGVRQLDPAQVGRARRSLRGDAGVPAGGVGVPDVHRDVVDRLARRRVHDPDAQVEPQPRPALGDVLADLAEVEVVRPLGELRRQRARRGVRLLGLAAAADEDEAAEPAAERREPEAARAEARERAAARDAGLLGRGSRPRVGGYPPPGLTSPDS